MSYRFQCLALSTLLCISPAVFAADAEDEKPAAKPQPRPAAVGAAFQALATRAANANYLLRNPNVQEELKLTDEQKTTIQDTQAELQAMSRELFGGLGNLTPEERRQKQLEGSKKLQEKRAEIDKKIDGLLEGKQKTRLEQIALQMRGIGALRDARISKQLELTEEQQQKIIETQSETIQARQKLFREAVGGGDRAKLAEKAREIVEQGEKKTLEVLTEKQREAFQKMQGEKFDFPLPRFQGIQAVPARIQLQNGQPRKLQVRPKKVEGDA